MKDIVIIKIAGYPSEEELVKITENLKEAFEGTNQKPLIIYGDTEVIISPKKDDDNEEG